MSVNCEYNFCCEDYAKDGTWKAWNFNVEKNAPAKHEITFYSKEQKTVFTYKVCDGCLDQLDNDDNEPTYIVCIAPQTLSYEGKRGKKYHSRVMNSHRKIKVHPFE